MPCNDDGPPADYYAEQSAMDFLDMLNNEMPGYLKVIWDFDISWLKSVDIKSMRCTKLLCSLCKLWSEDDLKSVIREGVYKSLFDWYVDHTWSDIMDVIQWARRDPLSSDVFVKLEPFFNELKRLSGEQNKEC